MGSDLDVSEKPGIIVCIIFFMGCGPAQRGCQRTTFNASCFR